MSKFWRVAGLAAALAVFAAPAIATDGGGDNSDHEGPIDDFSEVSHFYAEKNDNTGQISVYVSDGASSASSVYDAATDRIYISSPEGTVDFPLAEAAMSYAGGNLQIANQVANQIRGSSGWGSGFEAYVAPTVNFEPPGGSPGPCDLSPCGAGFYKLQTGEFSRHMGIKGYNDPFDDKWYELTYSSGDISMDKHYFEVWRKGQCDEETEDHFAVILGIGGGLVSCPAAPTGAGAVGCASSAVAVYKGITSDAMRNCGSKYPGPGRWGL